MMGPTHKLRTGWITAGYFSSVQPQDARRILGLDPSMPLDARVLRTAYRRMLRLTHPDVSRHPEAGERTAALRSAFEVLAAAVTDGTAHPTPPPTVEGARHRASRDATRPEAGPAPVRVRLLDDSSISVAAPADETFGLLLEASHDLGDVSYLDAGVGLVEVIVEFVEAPTSSVLFSLQGRADGSTEVFCTVEPLGGGEAPPAEAVTRLVAEALRDARS